jgi:hypothetical protein
LRRIVERLRAEAVGAPAIADEANGSPQAEHVGYGHGV